MLSSIEILKKADYRQEKNDCFFVLYVNMAYIHILTKVDCPQFKNLSIRSQFSFVVTDSTF